MITGHTFEVDDDGFVQWWKTLISGDELLKQDHELRFKTKQGSYTVDQEYGESVSDVLIQGVSVRELSMRIISEIRKTALQDRRFKECIVDQESIDYSNGGRSITAKYVCVKRDGSDIERNFNAPV